MDKEVFNKIKQLSNSKKFQIVSLTQEKPLNVGSLSKEVKIAFNKCSNYCTQLEENNLVEKQREGKNTLIKSKVIFSDNLITFK